MTDALLSPELIPVTELAQINATEAGLAQLRATATELAAMGVPTDEAAYQHLHRATMVAVKVRTETGKIAKRLAAPLKEQYEAIINEGKRIGDHAKASEDMLRPLKEQYETARENERIERDRLAAAKIQARTQTVIDLGMLWDGIAYEWAEYTVEGIDIQAAPDEQWDALLAPIIESVEANRLAIETRKQELLEAARIEREQLETQKREQEAARLELEKQQNELRQQQEAANAIILKDRTNRLFDAGFELDEQGIFHNGISQIRPTVILSFSEEQFDGVIADAVAYRQRKTKELADKLAMEQQAEKQVKIDAAAKLKPYKERMKRLGKDKNALSAWTVRLANFTNPRAGLTQPETDALAEDFLNRVIALAETFSVEIGQP